MPKRWTKYATRKALLREAERLDAEAERLDAEVEQLSKDRFDERARADGYLATLEHERRLRRAAEESSTEALRKQRIAETRLAALLDRYLGLDPRALLGPVTRASFDTSDAESPRG